MPVRIPRSNPLTEVSATLGPSTSPITTAMTTAPPMARMPIVVYCRRMKATAPSKMVAATSCIRAQEIASPRLADCFDWDRRWDVMVEACRPQLTSIDMDLEGIGRTAAELLLSAINGEAVHGLRAVPCRLVPRASTAV